jgi:hypothetical protein
MAMRIKKWQCFFISLGLMFFMGQVFKAGAYAGELSVQARKILANPPEKMKPSIQQELRRAWRNAASPIFKEFLPGLEDKFSYHARIVKLNNNSVILFQALGKKRSPDVSPVSQLHLEVFFNLDEKFPKRRYLNSTRDVRINYDSFEVESFVADQAAIKTRLTDGVESFFWQKGGHYIEVHSQSEANAIAQKVHLKLQNLGFYDFPAFLQEKDNSDSSFSIAGFQPNRNADQTQESVTSLMAKGKSEEWVFEGCYKDASSKIIARRDVFGYLTNENDMTNGKCMQHCRAQDYSVAATQFGTWCFCGTDFGNFGEADNCNMGCAGNPDEVCGGRWANSVYKLAPKVSSELK